MNLVRKKKSHSQASDLAADQGLNTTTPDFINLEKNLTSLCFFTPLKRQIKKARSKTITFSRTVGDKRLEAQVRISADEEYGLPTTADQDKYFALQKIIADHYHQTGEISNPINFSSSAILKTLGYEDGGGNYKDVEEWLDRMTATTIISKGAVYLAGKKRWVSDRFHVFDRVVSVGKELPDGRIAEQNYIWLSDWQLENIKNNHLLPVDFETYKKLKNHIAKALVPLLQIWLYASREDGVFEKRYDEICQILNLTQYKHASKIKEKLGPGLDEIKRHRYISDWKLKESKDQRSYIVAFYHGEKFYQDRRRRLGQPEPEEVFASVATNLEATLSSFVSASQEEDAEAQWTPAEQRLMEQLCRDFKVSRNKAELLVKQYPTETAMQLEAYLWREVKPANPAGWIIEAIRHNYQVPETFLEAQQRKEVKAKHEARQSAIKACPFCRYSDGFRLTTRGARPCTHDPAKEENDPNLI